MSDSGFYDKHLFLCTNVKAANKKSCGPSGGTDALAFLKTLIANHNSKMGTRFHVSASGCLGQCQKGPCLVIYPDNKWYRYDSLATLQQILDSVFAAGDARQHRIDGRG